MLLFLKITLSLESRCCRMTSVVQIFECAHSFIINNLFLAWVTHGKDVKML